MKANRAGVPKTGAAAVPVLVIVNSAELSHDDVEIAVAVEIAERGGGIGADIDAGDLGRRAEDRRGGRAGVGDREQQAVIIPHDDVEIAVAVEIAESGGREIAEVDDTGDLDRRAEHGRRRRAGIDDREQQAVVVSHDDVEIAVAVEIAERGGGKKTHIDAVKRIGAASAKLSAVPRVPAPAASVTSTVSVRLAVGVSEELA